MLLFDTLMPRICWLAWDAHHSQAGMQGYLRGWIGLFVLSCCFQEQAQGLQEIVSAQSFAVGTVRGFPFSFEGCSDWRNSLS